MTTPDSDPSAPRLPAVFLDRDGVLVDDIGLAHSDGQPRLTPGAATAVRRLSRLGYLVVVLDHASGAAHGLATREQVRTFNALLVRHLAREGAAIGAVHTRAFDAEDPIARWGGGETAPDPDILLSAVAEHRIDPARSFMIAGRPAVVEAARRAGLSAFRFEGGDLDAFVRELIGA